MHNSTVLLEPLHPQTYPKSKFFIVNMHGQSSSAFFNRLPIEIRLQIYDEAVKFAMPINITSQDFNTRQHSSEHLSDVHRTLDALSACKKMASESKASRQAVFSLNSWISNLVVSEDTPAHPAICKTAPHIGSLTLYFHPNPRDELDAWGRIWHLQRWLLDLTIKLVFDVADNDTCVQRRLITRRLFGRFGARVRAKGLQIFSVNKEGSGSEKIDMRFSVD